MWGVRTRRPRPSPVASLALRHAPHTPSSKPPRTREGPSCSLVRGMRGSVKTWRFSSVPEHPSPSCRCKSGRRGPVHVASHFARLGRDARLKHIVVSLGGQIVRVNPTGPLAEPGADIEALGLYFADAGQHLEQQVFVHHDAPP